LLFTIFVVVNIGTEDPCVIPSTKQYENKLGSQTRKMRAMLLKNLDFRAVLAVVDKANVRDDDDNGNLDIAEVNDFPLERHTRFGMR